MATPSCAASAWRFWMIKSFPLLVICLLGLPFMEQALAQPRSPGPDAAGVAGALQGAVPTFALQVCNKGKSQVGTIYLVTASLTPDRRSYRVRGWFQVPMNQCVNLGPFPRPGIFAYGNA